MPSTLPPSILNPPPSDPSAAASASASASPASQPKARYVVSNAGHAAHPDDIVATCREMHKHLDAMRADAERDLAALREGARQRELAEKRRIAPGWLDSELRVLEPQRNDGAAAAEEGEGDGEEKKMAAEGAVGGEGGEELDRAFGSMRVG
ncbi:uncharacterized protein DNG_03490 [Cephalotrichum gorgonifer]|uniref:Uncharacterized protein n=1 Tax=Cephalotrichum gorgonifer TaxID=2041049 RepID=A0AAE8MW13_9PEZI|nr:uncharacterized protein DNG_03490 [Cephalotrichum gorgonifer]